MHAHQLLLIIILARWASDAHARFLAHTHTAGKRVLWSAGVSFCCSCVFVAFRQFSLSWTRDRERRLARNRPVHCARGRDGRITGACLIWWAAGPSTCRGNAPLHRRPGSGTGGTRAGAPVMKGWCPMIRTIPTNPSGTVPIIRTTTTTTRTTDPERGARRGITGTEPDTSRTVRTSPTSEHVLPRFSQSCDKTFFQWRL